MVRMTVSLPSYVTSALLDTHTIGTLQVTLPALLVIHEFPRFDEDLQVPGGSCTVMCNACAPRLRLWGPNCMFYARLEFLAVYMAPSYEHRWLLCCR